MRRRERRTEMLAMRIAVSEKKKLVRIADKLDLPMTEIVVQLVEQEYDKIFKRK